MFKWLGLINLRCWCWSLFLIWGMMFPISSSSAPLPFQPERLHFSVKFKDEINPYRILGVFVMPAEEIELECVFTNVSSRFLASGPGGKLVQVSEQRWRWKAPVKEGLYPLTIREVTTNTTMTLQAIVMVPHHHQMKYLNGYRIGQYEKKLHKNQAVYAPPHGFIEVTAENTSIPISPHFTLGQFVSKQSSHYPKYLILRERLLLKLEMILEAVNQENIPASTLHVMSGFRTPYYNKLIGNPTVYSRHLYGGAADIFVDVDGNNHMDDLNHDKKISYADAVFLAEIVKSKSREAWYRPFVGGLGVYGPKPHRGPFVHVDVRGFKARWRNP